MTRGRAFFLGHQLYRSRRTGAEVNPAFRRFPFPPQCTSMSCAGDQLAALACSIHVSGPGKKMTSCG